MVEVAINQIPSDKLLFDRYRRLYALIYTVYTRVNMDLLEMDLRTLTDTHSWPPMLVWVTAIRSQNTSWGSRPPVVRAESPRIVCIWVGVLAARRECRTYRARTDVRTLTDTRCHHQPGPPGRPCWCGGLAYCSSTRAGFLAGHGESASWRISC